jgi:hypothetical protein
MTLPKTLQSLSGPINSGSVAKELLATSCLTEDMGFTKPNLVKDPLAKNAIKVSKMANR